jgi:ferrous iron transport protein B
MAIFTSWLFKKILFKGKSSPLVMELPPYRLPSFKNTWNQVAGRVQTFLTKAGTVILGASVIIWALATLPSGVEYASEASLLGRIGSLIAPLFSLAGFGTWQAAAALSFGVLAKEVVVTSLAVLFSTSEAGLPAILPMHFTSASALSFMVMSLLYMPCAATLGAIKRETGSRKWMILSMVYSLVIGLVLSVLVYQVAIRLGW